MKVIIWKQQFSDISIQKSVVGLRKTVIFGGKEDSVLQGRKKGQRYIFAPLSRTLSATSSRLAFDVLQRSKTITRTVSAVAIRCSRYSIVCPSREYETAAISPRIALAIPRPRRSLYSSYCYEIYARHTRRADENSHTESAVVNLATKHGYAFRGRVKYNSVMH